MSDQPRTPMDALDQLARDADTLEGLAADGVVSLEMSRRVREAATRITELEAEMREMEEVAELDGNTIATLHRRITELEAGIRLHRHNCEADGEMMDHDFRLWALIDGRTDE